MRPLAHTRPCTPTPSVHASRTHATARTQAHACDQHARHAGALQYRTAQAGGTSGSLPWPPWRRGRPGARTRRRRPPGRAPLRTEVYTRTIRRYHVHRGQGYEHLVYCGLQLQQEAWSRAYYLGVGLHGCRPRGVRLATESRAKVGVGCTALSNPHLVRYPPPPPVLPPYTQDSPARSPSRSCRATACSTAVPTADARWSVESCWATAAMTDCAGGAAWRWLERLVGIWGGWAGRRASDGTGGRATRACGAGLGRGGVGGTVQGVGGRELHTVLSPDKFALCPFPDRSATAEAGPRG